jgi:MSHA biogenesis protein MshO
MASRFFRSGFTLVEMIIVIAILGVISAVLAVFIRSPVEGYFDTVRRAELADAADTALRRMGRDVRRAVPNSVRVTGACGGANCYLEFLPTTNGGRYRAAGEGTVHCAAAAPTLHDSLTFSSDADTCFEVLGPPITFTANDQIVIGNWGNAGSNAYEGNTGNGGASHVRRAYAGATGAPLSFVAMTSANPLPLESPSRRFQVISGAEQAVSYACEGVGTNANGDGTGTLTRYWGYGIATAQPTAFAGGSLIAENVSGCNMVYGNLAATNPYTRNGLLQIVISITRSNETINLYHEIHVDNLP